MRHMRVVTPELLILAGLILGYVSWCWGRSDRYVSEKAQEELPNEGRTVDCGPASLYLIAKLSGQKCSIEEIRMLAKTTLTGTDMLSLKNAAASLGFTVEGCKCSFASIRKYVSNPKHYAILYSIKSHYVAVVGASGDDTIRVVDTVWGVRDLTAIELDRLISWDGGALLLTKSLE